MNENYNDFIKKEKLSYKEKAQENIENLKNIFKRTKSFVIAENPEAEVYYNEIYKILKIED